MGSTAIKTRTSARSIPEYCTILECFLSGQYGRQTSLADDGFLAILPRSILTEYFHSPRRLGPVPALQYTLKRYFHRSERQIWETSHPSSGPTPHGPRSPQVISRTQRLLLFSRVSGGRFFRLLQLRWDLGSSAPGTHSPLSQRRDMDSRGWVLRSIPSSVFYLVTPSDRRSTCP